jgi:hypothetical protein
MMKRRRKMRGRRSRVRLRRAREWHSGPPNRKKVRGWKKHIRRARHFAEWHSGLDLDALKTTGHEHVKLRLEPWFRYNPRQPPLWYRRHLVKALLDIHDAWRATLLAQGDPFWLGIWLFHPDFLSSQVVAVMGERIPVYRDCFFERDPMLCSFPPPEYADPAYDLSRFEWLGCKDLYWAEIDDPWRQRWAARLPLDSVRQLDGIEYTVHREGSVWVGSMPVPDLGAEG